MTDIAANLTTTAQADEGIAFAGEIETSGDEDWIAVTLEAGETYAIVLRGQPSGNGTLEDPFITGFYDADGNDLGLSDDDGAGNRESQLVFTPEVSGTYYVVAGAWSTNTGTYRLSYGDYVPAPQTADSDVPIEQYEISGVQNVDSLLTLVRFKDLIEDGVTIVTYSIPTTGSVYSADGYSPDKADSEPYNDISYLTQSEVVLFEDALNQISSFANIEFERVEDNSTSAGTIRPAWTGIEGENAAAWAYTPFSAPQSGDVWFLSENLETGGDGSYFLAVLLHELGHAVGLKHPFEEDGSGVVIQDEYDGLEYTVMSYTTSVESDAVQSLSYYPTTYMYYDILALRYIYGDVDTAPENTTYVWENGQTYYETIWDTGGRDTYDASSQTSNVHLDLQPGSWSNVGSTIQMYGAAGNVVGTKTETVFTPPEVTIEKAIGGSGDDTLTGNAAANVLIGNAGDDKILGGQGADTLRGNAGDDTVRGGDGSDVVWAGADDRGDDNVDGGAGADSIAGGLGDDFLVGGAGADVIYGGEGDDTLHGGDFGVAVDVIDTSQNRLWSGAGDDVITGAGGHDAIGAGSGDDIISAGAGNDTVFGGEEGDDRVNGGTGDDALFGGSGKDSLAGDGGADEIYGGSDDDSVLGGEGEDTLYGGAGADTLNGGSGNDILRPGDGDDLLIFQAGSGDDIVYGFSLEDDQLDLSETTTDFSGLDGVQAASTETADGLLIDLGADASVLLIGLTVADLATASIAY